MCSHFIRKGDKMFGLIGVGEESALSSRKDECYCRECYPFQSLYIGDDNLE